MISPIVAINRLLAEPGDPGANLRIIARDTPGMPSSDRELLVAAADEFEFQQKTIVALYANVTQLRQYLSAVEERARQKPSFAFMSMSAGSDPHPLLPKGWTT